MTIRIVFKNKREYEKFIKHLCPSDIDKDLKECCERYQSYFSGTHEKCRECWEKCGLKMEVGK